MSFWCLQFLPKYERKQVHLRYHSSKVEFVRSFFGRNVGLKKSFRLCLTFSDLLAKKQIFYLMVTWNLLKVYWYFRFRHDHYFHKETFSRKIQISNGFASDILAKKLIIYLRVTWNLSKVCWYFRFRRDHYFPEDIVNTVFPG